MSGAEIDTEGVEYFEIPKFKFASGAVLDVKIAYRSWNPTAPKAVLIPTCFEGRVNDMLHYTDGALKDYRMSSSALPSTY